jgi:hypothetical protein
MANGVYGTNIPTSISNDLIANYVDIVYSYSRTRNSTDVEGSKFEKLSSDNMKNVVLSKSETNDNMVDGLYNLKLPTDIFGKKGFYTIYIKPKEIPVTIMDVSTLHDFPTVRGIVIDLKAIPTELKGDASVNNGLVGYRVIYRNNDGTRSNELRIVTSNNKCEPVVNVSTTTNSKTYSYRYNENSTYTFITVTPSMPLSYKASSTPFIGKATQNIYLVNTLFEPICIELEMVENDIDTVTNILTGNQLRDLNNGLVTTFDKDNNILVQHEMSTLKSSETGTPQYEVKENRSENIDFTQTITDKL